MRRQLMEIAAEGAAAHRWVRGVQRDGGTVGLVPTMGALHEGHLSLVRASREACDRTVVTIFVNPAQFAPGEDLDRYPRTLQRDLDLLRAESADLVFTPSAETMYPAGFSTYVDPPDVARLWEGAARPHHFRGVATVVLKLLNLLPADDAFFGQKDYQQARVIQDMCRDLNVATRLHTCPIVRESDGLAMSSRNRYLSAEDRRRAGALPQALGDAERAVAAGERSGDAIEALMRGRLTEGGVDAIDYAVVADRETLARLERVDRPAVALVAARVGVTRLIDNLYLQP